MSKLSERLKEYMEEREETHLSLAKSTGIAQSNISEFLAGIHTPSYQNFIALLYHFECSADYLLGLTDIHTEEALQKVPPFKERLRAILKEQKISQEQLKRDLHISASVIYKWLSGNSEPSTNSLIRLAHYFECSVDYLIGRIR